MERSRTIFSFFHKNSTRSHALQITFIIHYIASTLVLQTIATYIYSLVRGLEAASVRTHRLRGTSVDLSEAADLSRLHIT